MTKYFGFAKRLRNDESGATAIEYGLLAALIAVGLIAILGTLEDSLTGNFQQISTSLDNAVPGDPAVPADPE